MSVTEVNKELRSRGIVSDCAAWYSWIHETEQFDDHPLGLDSCAIFYIGGDVQVKMPWNIFHLDILSAVAEDIEWIGEGREVEQLHRYNGNSYPSKLWHCCRSSDKMNIHQLAKNDISRHQKLANLLQPSAPYKHVGNALILKQKTFLQKEWFVHGDTHPGAHYPLCIWTNNISSRSAAAFERRRQNKRKN